MIRVYGRDRHIYENKDLCIAEVFDDWRSGQCLRKRGHGIDGLFCKQHAKTHFSTNQKCGKLILEPPISKKAFVLPRVYKHAELLTKLFRNADGKIIHPIGYLPVFSQSEQPCVNPHTLRELVLAIDDGEMKNEKEKSLDSNS